MTIRSNLDKDAGASQVEDKNPITSTRRSLVGAAVPAVLTLLSKPAFGAAGARCTISGFTSVNPSGVRHETSGCGGYSPGAWKSPYASNGDGSLAHWIIAGQNCATITGFSQFSNGFFPNPGTSSTSSSTAPGTLFDAVFGGSDGDTMHDKLEGNGNSLERSAVDALLNACFFEWGAGLNMAKIHPVDIVGLYQTSFGHQYVSVSGSSVTRPDDSALRTFFDQLMH